MIVEENADFTRDDLRQLDRRGISLATARAQLQLLRHPPPPQTLLRPCALGDGIILPGQQEELSAVAAAEAAAAAGRLTKFVPASGAATRMFASLARLDGEALARFGAALDRFPFAPLLPPEMTDIAGIVHFLLSEEGLGYRTIPKGLLPFHRYGEETRTAFEEHLFEGIRYLSDSGGVSRFHFTVSSEARAGFQKQIDALGEQLRGIQLEIEFSFQHPATDTLAIRGNGEPFRDHDGTLLFRPGGHGALLRNLSESGADIAVIKNIDNVVQERRSGEIARWKQIVIGHLLHLERQSHAILSGLERAGEGELDAALDFTWSTFARRPKGGTLEREAKRSFLRNALDRPIRVAGVVRNEGEPGGAPFWTVDRDGEPSLQMVESSQVDFANDEQRDIWNRSTHFNPVDLACTLRDWRGTPFSLEHFVDPEAVFITRKSHQGRALTGLELPGLWNGGMAGWNSVAIEVPSSTFAPVKSVFDLLRPEHQP